MDPVGQQQLLLCRAEQAAQAVLTELCAWMVRLQGIGCCSAGLSKRAQGVLTKLCAWMVRLQGIRAEPQAAPPAEVEEQYEPTASAEQPGTPLQKLLKELKEQDYPDQVLTKVPVAASTGA